MAAAVAEEKPLASKIAGILDECGLSHAVQPRKLKELSSLRSSSFSSRFFPSFARVLGPLFDFSRRTPAAERIVRFVSSFAARLSDKDADACDAFLEEFLRFLLAAAAAHHRPARFRACQIISEIVMLLPDDAEVSDKLWDDVIESMKQRVEDKVPAIRAFAVRALSRFANDGDSGGIVNLFLQTLPQEPNSEVRKMIVLSMPPTTATSVVIVESTRDVSESVRRAAYCVLASKFPLQSLSIKLRTIVLQRGLSDRSAMVSKECLKLLKDKWLAKCCDGDPMALLRFLDVETYEVVGESVMEALLKDGSVKVQEGHSMRQFVISSATTEDEPQTSFQLMEAEVALYWKALCRHLQAEAQAKGSDAAATTGTEAAVYASEASSSNELLDQVLPGTVYDFVGLATTHLAAGPNYRFVSRQLLLLGAMLDFSDTTNRKVAAVFVRELLLRPLEFEIDDDGNKLIIGDGISLGGDKDWTKAVAELTRKVHASVGEFETIVTDVIEELARPCRERTADFLQWMHCLAVTGLLLENTKSLRSLQGKAIGPSELLHSLLLPGAKFIHADVQRVATRCLCLFGLLERRPSEELVKQLRLSFIVGPSLVSTMAAKALIDLATWHSPAEVDKSAGIDLEQSSHNKRGFTSVTLSSLKEDVNLGALDLLFSGFEEGCFMNDESEDQETVQDVLAEGFAKFLLLSENYHTISASLHSLILCRLITLYFNDDTKGLQRLKQCLSVFFDHYPALSYKQKKFVSSTFIPVMRFMWPGIYGNSGGSPVLISKMRKRAVHASRFMLQMMQTPLFPRELDEEKYSEKSPESLSGSLQSFPDFESGEEGLAIRIAAEVANFPEKKTAAGKAYILALCKVLVLLQFRSSEQDVIRCMRGLLNIMLSSVSSDKELMKELSRMATRLKSLDKHSDQELSQEQANVIFRKLELDVNLRMDVSTLLPPTPAPCATRTAPAKRRFRREASSDDDEPSPIPAVPATPSLVSGRSARASKTAAMSKMSANANIELSDAEDEDDSDVTSEESSDESCDVLSG